jgi:hypothetical protein
MLVLYTELNYKTMKPILIVTLFCCIVWFTGIYIGLRIYAKENPVIEEVKKIEKKSCQKCDVWVTVYRHKTRYQFVKDSLESIGPCLIIDKRK